MTFAHGSYDENNSNHSGNKVDGSAEHQNFVQLVFHETRSLGLEIFRNHNGVVYVKRVSEGGQAESICIDTLLEPEVLDDATLVAINGVPFDARDTGIQLYNELKSRARPKNILFALRTINMPDVKHAFCVNKIRNGKFVEFVFWKDIMGVRVNQIQHENFLIVDSIDKNTEAADNIHQCLLDPNVFKGASIVGVNGRKYKKKSAMFKALTSSNRPKFVLFELSQSLTASSLYDTTAATKPPTKHTTFETPQKGIEQKMPLTVDSLTQMNDEASPESPRKKSATMLEKAVYASKSMRQLAVVDDKDDDDVGTASTASSPRSPSPRRQIHSPDQDDDSMSDSKRKLETCLDEMEKLNLQIDEEAENQRKLEASMARMQKLNMENERSVSICSPLHVSMDTTTTNGTTSGGGGGGDDGNENWSHAHDQMVSPRSLKARAILQGFKNKIGTTSFGGPAEEDEEDEEETAEHERLKQEAYEACIKAIRDHLEAFLAETPDVSYEEWIEELHPENAKARRNYVKGRVIDHRFYVENSDHRKLWNEHLEEDGAHGGVTIRQYVPIREYVPFGDRYNDNNANMTSPVEQTKKSLCFKRKSDVSSPRTPALKF